MESNKELVFEVMVTSPKLLQKEVEEYNSFHKTNFEIIEIIDDEVPFCKLKVSKYDPSNVFGLGYSLALLENRLREKGEIDW